MPPQNVFNFVLFNSLLLYLPFAALMLWRKPSLWLPLWTLFLGIILGWWDMHSTEVSASVLMLLTFSFFAGYAQPKRAWLSALLLGMWIPIFGGVGRALQLIQTTPTEMLTSLLAFAFTFSGAYGGALVRRFSPPEQLTGMPG